MASNDVIWESDFPLTRLTTKIMNHRAVTREWKEEVKKKSIEFNQKFVIFAKHITLVFQSIKLHLKFKNM